jgi:hypothetical protein
LSRQRIPRRLPAHRQKSFRAQYYQPCVGVGGSDCDDSELTVSDREVASFFQAAFGQRLHKLSNVVKDAERSAVLVQREMDFSSSRLSY